MRAMFWEAAVWIRSDVRLVWRRCSEVMVAMEVAGAAGS